MEKGQLLISLSNKINGCTLLTENYDILSNDFDVAESFQNYYSNITPNLDRKKHPNTSAFDYLTDPGNNSFFCTSSKSKEVLKIMLGEHNKYL